MEKDDGKIVTLESFKALSWHINYDADSDELIICQETETGEVDGIRIKPWQATSLARALKSAKKQCLSK